MVGQVLKTPLCTGSRAGHAAQGQHPGERLRQQLPEVDVQVPLRQLLRAVQQRVPGQGFGPTRNSERICTECTCTK